MKKHIFGFALFSVIIAVFALIFAFIYAPVIPQIEEVRQVETKYEKPYSCNMKRMNLTYTVESSEFYVKEGRFISKLKLKWNGQNDAPKTFFVRVRIFDINNPEDVKFYRSQNFDSPFGNGNEAEITFDNSDLMGNLGPNKKYNFYVFYEFFESYTNPTSLTKEEILSKAKPVLTSYGKSQNTEVKEVKPILKGTKTISE